MKRSKKIDLTIITILAASFIACSNNSKYDDYNGNIKHCVDKNGIVVSDSNCNSYNSGNSSNSFLWYYGAYKLFSPGSHVYGGSYSPSYGSHYSTPSEVTRSGFGSTGRSSISHSSGE